MRLHKTVKVSYKDTPIGNFVPFWIQAILRIYTAMFCLFLRILSGDHSQDNVTETSLTLKCDLHECLLDPFHLPYQSHLVSASLSWNHCFLYRGIIFFDGRPSEMKTCGGVIIRIQVMASCDWIHRLCAQNRLTSPAKV